MNRRTNANAHAPHGERQPSAAARAAMARASGQSNAGTAPRSAYATPRMKIRSMYYRLVYGSVISGSPTQQSQKALTMFRRSLLGCLIFIYFPMMCLGYALVNYNSSKDSTVPMENLDHLYHQSFPHGSFFFGSTSHEISIPEQSIWKPSWTPTQQTLLNDDVIDIEVEKTRCERYNMGYTNQASRRRLFLGALIADESMEVLEAISTEAYNIFHTVSFIESNITQNLTPRNWKFSLQSENLLKLQQLFGPQTRVSVDYFATALKNTTDGDNFQSDALQRKGSNLRWKINGMTKDDVAIVADADETFSRDFLRALQICDLPEFRPGQTCQKSKVRGGPALVYEGSPNCVVPKRRRFHPAAILGECMLLADDIRADDAGTVYSPKDGSATGYHFHNFFMTSNEIKKKYHTNNGHAMEAALEVPLKEIHEDLALGVDCAHDTRNVEWEDFAGGGGDTLPIYYLNPEARVARHLKWKNIVKEDEE